MPTHKTEQTLEQALALLAERGAQLQALRDENAHIFALISPYRTRADISANHVDQLRALHRRDANLAEMALAEALVAEAQEGFRALQAEERHRQAEAVKAKLRPKVAAYEQK